MVNIRRPPNRNQGSLFSVRNALILIIVFQAGNLIFKFWASEDSANAGQQLWHAIEKAEQELPDILKVHQDTTKQESHSDADDEVEKPEWSPKKEIPLPPKRQPNSNLRPNDLGIDKDTSTDGDDEEEEESPEKGAEPTTVVATKHVARVQEVDLDPQTAEVLQRHGSGPTRLGYVVDMVYERTHAAFRSDPLPSIDDIEQKVSTLVSDKVKSCHQFSDQHLVTLPICRDTETPLYAYNSAKFPRTFCGKLIEPGEAIKVEDHCDEPVSIFPVEEPPLTGAGMPPIVVQSNKVQPKNRLEDVTCDIPCKFEANMSGNDRFFAGTNWKMIQTYDDPLYNEDARVERTDYQRDIYYSTVSRTSSIPLSFFSFDKYSVRDRPAISWESAANKASYLQNGNCESRGVRRQKWAAAVATGFDLEAYGSCQHTKDLEAGETLDTLEGRIALSKKNRIHLALEGGSEKDYMTEITWEAFLSGAVPAIMTASNGPSILPPNSFIPAAKYNNWDVFATYIKEVSENKTLWESFQSWRTDEEALKTFENKFEFTRTSPECRMCRWAYAKMYGLGWDHIKQSIRETRIPRKLCVSGSSKFVASPFREHWVQRGTIEDLSGEAECLSSSSATIEHDGYKITRKVARHNGVVDITLDTVEKDSEEEEIRVQFLFDIRNTDGAYFRDSHTIVSTERGSLVSSASMQDEHVKITVLASWVTKVHSSAEGLMEVIISAKGESLKPTEDKRIRIIVEDMSPIHDKLTEYFPSSFAKTMIADFVDPFEMFYLGT